MSQEMFAKAVYVIGKEHAMLVYHFGFTPELVEYISGGENEVLRLDGDTHLARFINGGAAIGMLKNTMPGSKFTQFTFFRGTIGGVKIVVGVYK